MSRPRKNQSGGFTLLELLIGLAVTAAVVALMFAGFGVIGRSEEKNQRVIDRAERIGRHANGNDLRAGTEE